jgi:uncharacterized protein YhaN
VSWKQRLKYEQLHADNDRPYGGVLNQLSAQQQRVEKEIKMNEFRASLDQQLAQKQERMKLEKLRKENVDREIQQMTEVQNVMEEAQGGTAAPDFRRRGQQGAEQRVDRSLKFA